MNKDINSKLEALTIGMGKVIQRADTLMDKFEANKDDITNIITQLNNKISKEEADIKYCLKSPKTKVTVGENGDFKTINEALSFAFKESSINYFKIILKSGFVLKEQVVLYHTTFFVEISAEDEYVNADIASLTKNTAGSGRFFFTTIATSLKVYVNIKINAAECDTSGRFGLFNADYMSNLIFIGDCDLSLLTTTRKNFIFAEIFRNSNAYLGLGNMKLPKKDSYTYLISVSGGYADLRLTSLDKALENCFIYANEGGFVSIPYAINIESNNEKPIFNVFKGACICASSVIFAEGTTNKFNIPENTLTPSGIIFK